MKDPLLPVARALVFVLWLLVVLLWIVVLTGCGFTIEGNGAAVDAPDASIDAREIDAQIDAMPCMPQPRELLANGAFDVTPVTWVESAPIITDQGPVASETAPNKAWLGGTLSASDSLYQDVMVPPSTGSTIATQLMLTGRFQVRTTEPSTSAHDTAYVTMEGRPLFEVDNRMPTTQWETFVVPFNEATGTHRLTISSMNDEALATNFYFDSLSLTAMVCP